jgi:UDP-N-acetylmuramyl pentapeptide phosphotransferase/UDP-N-acetylglucosamine-1-phosphate transferase
MIALIILFLISFGLTGIYRQYAIRKSIFDIPNSRSSHKVSTPLGGGIAISITWFIAITFLFLKNDIPSSLFFALLSGVPISLIGLIDDIITIPLIIRLFVQIISSTMAIFFLGGIISIDVGFSHISIPVVFSILSIVGIVWFTNLFNFLDGIDGYISTEVIFICLTAYVLFGSVLPLFLMSAVAGFLLWNWQPAKIFMGDVGSTLLGFTIGVFAVHFQNINQSSILTWLMLSSLFWFDATITLFRRMMNHEKLSVPHKKHAYQRIVQFGFTHQRTVISATLINCAIFILILLSISYPKYLLIFFSFNIVLLFTILNIVDRKFPFAK